MTTGTFIRRLTARTWRIPENSPYAYGGALVMAGVALGARLVLAPLLDGLLFITLFPAIVLSALLFGPRPGLVCAAASGLAAWYWFMPPVGSFKLLTTPAMVGLALYAAIAALIAVSIGALRHAVRREQSASQRLTSERELLMSVFEAMPVGIGLADASARVTYLNPAAIRIHGYSSLEEALDEMGAPDRRLEVTTADGEALPPAQWPRHRAARGDFVKDYELHLKLGDRERWASFTALPLTGGDIRTAFVIHDITEQKEAETQQRLLVNELNHRVKNTLATVQSIARQTMKRATSLDGFQDAFEARLTALSQTHNVLTAGRWERARLSDLLRQEMRPYSQEQVRLNGPDVEVSAPIALSLGMIFHELATNAAKYGALSNNAGCVRISWQVGGDDRLKLEWCETGGPEVVPPTHRGFGSLLVERSLTAHGGRAELTFPAHGVCCTIEAPLQDTPTPMHYAFG